MQGDARAGRGGLRREELGVDRVDAREERQIRQVDRCLDHAIETAAARREHGAQVREDLARLVLDFAGDDLARRSVLMAFDALGEDHELVAGARRRMAALLH